MLIFIVLIFLKQFHPHLVQILRPHHQAHCLVELDYHEEGHVQGLDSGEQGGEQERPHVVYKVANHRST